MFVKQPRGSTLVFVLMIMLVAMVITTTVTTVIVNNLQTATAFNQHAHGYYAMESGLERALYYAQFARASKTVAAGTTAGTLSTLTGDLGNGASYSVSASFIEDSTATDLAIGEAAQFDFYQEDSTSGYRLTPITDLDNISVDWVETSSCAGSSLISQIEVSFSSWTQFDWEDISDYSSAGATHFTYTCPSPPSSCNTSVGVDSSHLYKVRVKALNCDIESLTVTPEDTFYTTLSVANTLDIEATGDYGQISRSGGATTPWSPALNRYFEYVLFSEDEIRK